MKKEKQERGKYHESFRDLSLPASAVRSGDETTIKPGGHARLQPGLYDDPISSCLGRSHAAKAAVSMADQRMPEAGADAARRYQPPDHGSGPR